LDKLETSLLIVLVSFAFLQPHASGEEKYNRRIIHYPYDFTGLTVIGEPTSHTIRMKDTFLDISRDHELGFNEMAILYPDTDPWMPPVGENIEIPSFWVLPSKNQGQLVINIPELRLYFFEKDNACVQTYPVSIGIKGWETPPGNFYITEKRDNPSWYIPKSLQKKYGLTVMPPGPENPLGKYIMKFSYTSYSIHGTHMPWGVGRLISHGCIRCYPEHIALLYPQVNLGTKVEIIYEPIKFGKKHGRIFVEIHPDVYNRISDFKQYAAEKLSSCQLSDLIDQSRYEMAVLQQNGMPVDLTPSSKNDQKNIFDDKSVFTEFKSPD